MDFEGMILSSVIIMDELSNAKPSNKFERIGDENGGFWWGRQFMELMGYATYQAFQKAIGRAMQTCSTVEFSISEHFKSEVREVNGESVEDYKLTRFACYLVAMSGDPNKPEVAAARVYFANLAVAIQALHTDPDAIPRVQIRDDLSQREKSLSGVAKSAGVIQERYGLFQNAGYMGLYNMNLGRLKDYKGFSGSGTLLDFMGKEELAANLFRVTQTEAKIRKDGIRGQAALENAAQSVGREVRNAMIRASGTVPENLPLAEDIKKVKTKIKQAQKQLGSIDSPKKPKS